ncbi:MAG: polyprenyl diphosphate synthase [Desulfurococcaceae archaeon]
MLDFKEVSGRIIANLFRASIKPIYKVYEKLLWMQIRNGPFPRHIGIIPDGNRRWARERGLNPSAGHLFGYEKIKEVLKWLWELRIPYATVFAMSTENCLYRSLPERENLFTLAKKGFNELLSMPELHENKVRVLVVGKFDYIPDDLKELVKKLTDTTSSYDQYFLTIALCYGGRQEIIDAVKRIAADVERGALKSNDVDEEIFLKYLYTGEIPDLDLVVRTSGEERISNFLLWHSAYSELYFCDAYWPEFRKIDFWRAIRSYQRKERRFGR